MTGATQAWHHEREHGRWQAHAGGPGESGPTAGGGHENAERDIRGLNWPPAHHKAATIS